MDLVPIIMYLLAIFVLASMFSMLWKDNPFYRFIQYGALAQAMTMSVFTSWAQIYKVAIVPLLKGDLLMIVPLALGVLIFFNRFGVKRNWLARYPLALGIGIGTALSLAGAIPTQILGQMKLIIGRAVFNADFVSNLVFILTALSALTYFFFYFLHNTAPGRGVSRIGRYTIMIWVGASFGTMLMMNVIFLAYTVMYASIFGVPAAPNDIPSYAGAVIVVLVMAALLWVWNKNQKKEPKAI